MTAPYRLPHEMDAASRRPGTDHNRTGAFTTYPYTRSGCRGRRIRAVRCVNFTGGAWLEVIAVDAQWEVLEDKQWFLDRVDRRHFRVTLEDGQQMTVYRTSVHGGWHRVPEDIGLPG